MNRMIQTTNRALSTSNNANLENIFDNVKDYYGKVLNKTQDLKTSACTASKRPADIIVDAIQLVPNEVNEKFYGCGSPIPTAIDGLSVLDLGSGSGRDSYIAANLVGEQGKVFGIDMTEEQLNVAKNNADDYCKGVLGYKESNLKFSHGYIEDIKTAGVEDNSIDLAISNCVINLSPDKRKVIQGVYNALKEGGELYFSDVYCDRRVPIDAQQNEVLWGECISGALYIEDFKRICSDVGFKDIRVLESAPIEVTDPKLNELIGDCKFYSITYRCFKLENMETLCEDYGQVAYYNGTIPGSEFFYELDDHHVFEKNRPMLVCGNTASMVSESWLKPHFKVIGDRTKHFGLFDCGPSPAISSSSSATDNNVGGGCC